MSGLTRRVRAGLSPAAAHLQAAASAADPFQNSMFGCYDDLSGAKKYSCNLLFYWLGLLFAGGLG